MMTLRTIDGVIIPAAKEIEGQQVANDSRRVSYVGWDGFAWVVTTDREYMVKFCREWVAFAPIHNGDTICKIEQLVARKVN